MHYQATSAEIMQGRAGYGKFPFTRTHASCLLLKQDPAFKRRRRGAQPVAGPASTGLTGLGLS